MKPEIKRDLKRKSIQRPFYLFLMLFWTDKVNYDFIKTFYIVISVYMKCLILKTIICYILLITTKTLITLIYEVIWPHKIG